ncbi:aldose epimerase family protein [Cucumibacter marinus]|uniref:hypothetical protein n=1 Tax=Cucumibacter marinus TaxID=1121252 RepID=UPI00041EA7C9|nr:hypothetical protein [Cucumibacter marinus]
MSDMSWHFSWDRGRAQIVPAGGMIGPVEFELEGGRSVQPFAIAPWSDDEGPDYDALPRLLQKLRGEWIGVPFGMPEPLASLPADWLDGPAVTRGYGDHFHGYSSNADWTLTSAEEGAAEMVLDYPEDHPVRRVTRTIRGVEGRSRLAFEFGVETRRAVELPLGIHPVFHLPETPGAASLEFAGSPRVRTYPVDAEPGISRFAIDQKSVPLDGVPMKDGTTADLTRLPLAFDTEELVLVTGHEGVATLRFPQEGYAIRLQWDATAFPACMLWISNHGRTAYPWNGRFRAIGIEPVVSAFDLGTDVSQNPDNPLRRQGISTTHRFEAGEEWTTGYTIDVFPD